MKCIGKTWLLAMGCLGMAMQLQAGKTRSKPLGPPMWQLRKSSKSERI
jgi:hypothetical protein